ncbi:hypothetical protein L1I30_07025 [Gillisia sp. M10.2A]|uniref:Uncharacterized protein n=1 Tax=Gillisia lutea TaxID=2909668 RepID=A0ABS9EEV6_9FLAO|nr:hypothetical protein [Gillisia lutea]MCF4101412.1 hypothetical protein [Gillisia lutea]
MKNTAMILLGVTSLILIAIVVLVSVEFSFSLIFYLTCIGQILLLVTVYKILTDDYSTDKTFDDFYEDYPIDREK